MARIEIKIPDWLDKICAWPVVMYRKYRYKDSFRKIPLGQGLFALVSPKDFYWVSNYRWCAKGNNKRIYAVRFDVYSDNGKTIAMHREIMKDPAGMLVDHRNNIAVDNRRSNLRLATSSQNNSNRRINKSKSYSKFRGVLFDRRREKLFSKIKVNGKSIYLGTFDNEIDAAKAYDRAAKKYFGEFACLNFPEATDTILK